MSRSRPFKRTDRLNRQIRDVLAVALHRETHEEVLQGAVVTGVEVTRDLSLARVYYYVMTGERAEIEKALERARGFLRCRVGDSIRMRQVPELRFQHDDAVDRGRRVDQILRGIDLPPAAAEADAGPDAGALDDPSDEA